MHHWTRPNAGAVFQVQSLPEYGVISLEYFVRMCPFISAVHQKVLQGFFTAFFIAVQKKNYEISQPSARCARCMAEYGSSDTLRSIWILNKNVGLH